MNISVTVALYAGDDLAMTAQEIAERFLADVGGDPSKDTVSVTVTDTGQAGGLRPEPKLDPPPA